MSLKFPRVATLVLAIGSLPVCTSSAAAESIRYTLEGIWLDPDISGSAGPRQMTGALTWTFETGDFENGSAVLTEIDLPWIDVTLDDLAITAETGSIEITLDGNFHDLGVDISLFLAEPLSPDTGSPIDLERSAFQIERGVIYQGHVISGSVEIFHPVCAADLTGDGILDLADVAAFATAFIAGADTADLAPPSGVLDLEDIAAFVASFVSGCAS